MAILARISSYENFELYEETVNKINETLGGWSEYYEQNDTNNDIVDSIAILVINAEAGVDVRTLASLAFSIENRNAITLLSYIVFK